MDPPDSGPPERPRSAPVARQVRPVVHESAPETVQPAAPPERRKREQQDQQHPGRSQSSAAKAGPGDAASAGGAGAPGPFRVSTTSGTGSPTVFSDAATAHGTSMPMATAVLGSLAVMSSGFGTGTPTAVTGQPFSPPMAGNGAPSEPIAWDSEIGAEYAAADGTGSEKSSTIGALNAELEQVLGEAADSSACGRATMAAIIAEVDAALTALGPVGNTPAGRQQVLATLTDALGRAGNAVDRNRIAAAVSSDRIADLAAKYAQNSAPQRGTYHAGAGRPPTTAVAGTQGQWIDEALRVLAQNGYDTDQINPAAIATIIAHESSGNPHAINLWDSNAAAGHPSKGLMQTIDSTFDAYALPGHRDIWNPVDNIIAGVRYSIDRYGSVNNVPGVAQLNGGGSYVGY